MTPQPPNLTSVAMPASQISAPKHIQWHMILDNELDMLTDKETGVMGALGFTALGGIVGGLIPCIAAVEKLNKAPLTLSDLVALAIFFLCLSAALICLITFFVNRSKNGSLKYTIRSRGKPEQTPQLTGISFTINQ